MPEVERKACAKCGKVKRETEFFKKKTGERHELCKQCLTMNIDNRDPETFKWILKEFDVPYIERTWVTMANKIYLKNPAKFGPMSVLGQYLRSMNMSQYKEYSYADSDKLNFEDQKVDIPIDKQKEEQLRLQLEAGEISQAQYETLSATTASSADLENTIDDIPHTSSSSSGFVPDYEALNEEKLREQLTEDDMQYLMLKWGVFYKPSEWVKLEDLYSKYAAEYDMNVDREETLKKICKTSLKMDQALDVGDLSGYKSLSGVFDQLRKSGKFTDAQNKENQVKELDTIGELVALCERAGGPIKNFVDPDEYPQDKIDFTIRDLKAYNYNLATKELNLGDIIEKYIEKLEASEEQEQEDMNNLVIDAEEEEAQGLTEEEADSFQAYLEAEIEKDLQMSDVFNEVDDE